MEACCLEVMKSVLSSWQRQRGLHTGGSQRGLRQSLPWIGHEQRSTHAAQNSSCTADVSPRRRQGPTARQDAERAEKSRWLGHLATLLVGTYTPFGQRLVQNPAACHTMGLDFATDYTRFAGTSPVSPCLVRSPSRQSTSTCLQESCAPEPGLL